MRPVGESWVDTSCEAVGTIGWLFRGRVGWCVVADVVALERLHCSVSVCTYAMSMVAIIIWLSRTACVLSSNEQFRKCLFLKANLQHVHDDAACSWLLSLFASKESVGGLEALSRASAKDSMLPLIKSAESFP